MVITIRCPKSADLESIVEFLASGENENDKYRLLRMHDCIPGQNLHFDIFKNENGKVILNDEFQFIIIDVEDAVIDEFGINIFKHFYNEDLKWWINKSKLYEEDIMTFIKVYIVRNRSRAKWIDINDKREVTWKVMK